MRILIESYNNVMQNPAGGVSGRIKNYINTLKKSGIEAKLFNKWEDKIIDYDIIHIFKLNTEDYQLVKYAKKLGKKIVISSVVPQEKKLNIILNLLITKFLPIHTGYSFMHESLLLSDVIVTQTKKEALFINKYYKISKEKIKTIPNGANTNLLNGDEMLIKDKLSLNEPYILQVGRFDKNKNQINVIKAMNSTNIPVVFVGGPDPMELEYYEKCKKIANKNIYFLGWLNNDDPLLASAYKNAKVVILPSYKEIFGNSLIEGGIVGANLVATKELPIEELGIKEYCYTIDPNNIQQIRDVLTYAYDSPKSNNTQKLFLKLFSWESVVKKYVDIYKQLLYE